METLKHFFGACEDHATHLDLRDIIIIATAIVALTLLSKLKKSRA